MDVLRLKQQERGREGNLWRLASLGELCDLSARADVLECLTKYRERTLTPNYQGAADRRKDFREAS